MTSKNKSRTTELRFDKGTGRYCAKIGRKRMPNGSFDGHLFRFSADERDSDRRKSRIQELWDHLIDKNGAGYLWTDDSLKVAKVLEKGLFVVTFGAEEIAPTSELRWQPMEWRSQAKLFAVRLIQLQKDFPMVSIAPTDADCDVFERGRVALVASAESVLAEGRSLAELVSLPVAGDPQQPKMLEAIERYEDHIRETMLVIPDPEEGINEKRLSDTAVGYLRQFVRIKEANAAQMSWPLSRLTYQGCDEMLEVWRQRPLRKDRTGPMAVKTCREHAKRIKEFLRWLSKSDLFDWKKPLDFDELKIKIRKTPQEKAAPITNSTQQVTTYTLDELVILAQYANPHERFIFLCGLNCGFKRMEISTLRVGEVLLEQMHPHDRYISFEFFPTDSFIRRLRTKTEVLGEWILWPLTVVAMKWALTRRKLQTHITKGQGRGREIPFSPNALLYLNDSGHSYTKKTESGNANNQLTNAWNRLLKRVRADHPDFRRLPHESLRDTSANWIREEFGGEVAETFLSHGEPLGTKTLVECYTNKPFNKLFTAVRWLELKMQPVFNATPEDPFPQHRKLGGGGLTLSQRNLIRKLAKENHPVRDIALQANCSEATVYRHLNRKGKK